MSHAIQCPECKRWDTKVVDVRTSTGNVLPNGEPYGWRRRKCDHCSYRFTTYELTREQVEKHLRWNSEAE